MKRYLYLGLVILLTACTGRTIYSHYEPLPLSGWHADSAMRYDFVITDTLQAYDLVINLRHTERYPNQNFWVFAALYRDSLLLSADTLDYYLADQRGRWHGNGFGDRRDMPMLYKRQYLFEHAGAYHLSLQHGMRDTLLTGVSDIGFTIEKSE